MCPSTPAQCCRCLSRPVRPSPDLWLRMLWRVSRPLRSRSKPDGFILPCQPALADRPPSGPEWLREIKFDGYYSKALTRGRPEPVDSAALGLA